MTRNKKIHYFHSAAFVSLIEEEPRLIIDFELYKGTKDSSKKDEDKFSFGFILHFYLYFLYNLIA